MNYVDRHIKTINEDKTIGIIICKKDNKFILEYCSDKRVLSKDGSPLLGSFSYSIFNNTSEVTFMSDVILFPKGRKESYFYE